MFSFPLLTKTFFTQICCKSISNVRESCKAKLNVLLFAFLVSSFCRTLRARMNSPSPIEASLKLLISSNFWYFHRLWHWNNFHLLSHLLWSHLITQKDWIISQFSAVSHTFFIWNGQLSLEVASRNVLLDFFGDTFFSRDASATPFFLRRCASATITFFTFLELRKHNCYSFYSISAF